MTTAAPAPPTDERATLPDGLIVPVRRRRHLDGRLVGGGALLALIVLACWPGALLAQSPTAQDLALGPTPPSRQHWMGTDELGRDVLARVLHGGRVSIAVGLGAALGAALIGGLLGAWAGYRGGWRDDVAMRGADLWVALPAIPLVALVESIGTIDLGPLPDLDLGSAAGISVVLALLLWGASARVVRARAWATRHQPYVLASESLGARSRDVIRRHVLPACSGPLLVSATITVAVAILFESTLSFLGFGVQPPTPTWGNMLSNASANLEHRWWLVVFPGLAIFVTLAAVHLLGDGLGDRLDPRRRRR